MPRQQRLNLNPAELARAMMSEDYGVEKRLAKLRARLDQLRKDEQREHYIVEALKKNPEAGVAYTNCRQHLNQIRRDITRTKRHINRLREGRR